MTTTNSTVECSHCLLKFNKNTAITETEKGETLHFCCPGCQSVYHIIKDGGFDSFYKKRRDYRPGPPELALISDELFLDDIIEHESYSEIEFIATNIRCAACIWLIENYLSKLSGIRYVRANYATHKVKIQWDKTAITLNEILNGIANLGYTPVPVSAMSSSDYFEKLKKSYFYKFSIGAFFTMQIMIYSVALYAGYFQGIDESLKEMFKFIAMLLATPVVFYSGLPFASNSIKSLKTKTLNMDTLVFLGSYSAYFYSVFGVFTQGEIYFDTSAMIITLILLGRYIETEAKIKASKEISLLFNLQPKQAKLFKYFNKNDYICGKLKPMIVKVSSIKKGDILEVLPGENIPVDGKVIYGESEVNEAMFTGESVPVLKKQESDVISGTNNLNGTLIIEATKSSKESSLSKIAEAIKSAQESKFYFQKLADKITVFFVPTVIAIAFATFLYWFNHSSSFVTSFMNAVSVLVIACPCAMGLATPLAILVATSTAFKKGILIKEGSILENASRVKAVFFDKTGTITEGVPKIVNIKSYDNNFDTLKIAASLERFSKHILAKSIVSQYTEGFEKVTDVKEIPGQGMLGNINTNIQAAVGNMLLFNNLGINIDTTVKNDLESLTSKGYTNILVAYDKKIIGIISLFDNVKESFGEIYTFLTKKHIEINVITGDTKETSENVLRGFPNIKILSSLSPLEKVEVIKNNLHKFPIMIGDGINDAPSLKQAFIGIGMGKGTEIALESSDAVFVNSNLLLLKDFLILSKKTRSIIIENLFWAFSYNFVTIPLAISGKIHPVFSAVLMSISSLIVVFNSLRIKTLSR
ncbi:heavy metal translocating P-type ATPase [Deferribacteraceae bacterium V6Fe1]|nr:heavy metal translocating P-type ATPase [Deferribacteraceae bacterium V6Fe1]